MFKQPHAEGSPDAAALTPAILSVNAGATHSRYKALGLFDEPAQARSTVLTPCPGISSRSVPARLWDKKSAPEFGTDLSQNQKKK